VVVAEIRGEVSLRLAGIQDDEKVQRVSADRSDEPFGVWILPRTSRRREHLFNTNRIFADYRCHEMRHRPPSTLCAADKEDRVGKVFSVFDLATRQTRALPRVEGGVDFDLFPDGSRLAVSIRGQNESRVWIVHISGDGPRVHREAARARAGLLFRTQKQSAVLVCDSGGRCLDALLHQSTGRNSPALATEGLLWWGCLGVPRWTLPVHNGSYDH
jgi:hypothetical protein